jgi:hypothetical protein
MVSLLMAAPQLVIMGGDFVLERKVATGTFNYSHALDGLMRGIAFQDAWQGGADPPGYTHNLGGGGTFRQNIHLE